MTSIAMPVDSTRVNSLSTLKLPTLSGGTPYLMKSMTDENIGFGELAAVLEKFPSIAGKLISLANSVWSAPAAEITSLEASCSRLGFGVVRSTSIALAIAAPFDPARCESFDSEYFWCSALLSAEAAARLTLAARLDDKPEVSTARAAGLLHNLGLLWLVDKLPEQTDLALKSVAGSQANNLRQALDRILGFDHAIAGGHLAKAWKLPGPLTTAMARYPEARYQGSHQGIVSLVGLAVELVATVIREEVCPIADIRLARLGISAEQFNQTQTQLVAQLQRTRDLARLLT